ncbi:MAG TPA: archease [bacterium]|nr:archease [bacterium]
MTTSGFREIDHTADVGLLIWASSLDELFVQAARGMFSLLLTADQDKFTPIISEREQKTYPVELMSTSIDLLLREWLSELLYIHLTERIYFTDFDIGQVDDTHVTAQVAGIEFSGENEHLFTEIKAVTYHGLEVTTDQDGFRAQVIFDI